MHYLPILRKQFVKQALIGIFMFSIASLAYADLPNLPKALKPTNPTVKLTLLEFSAPWCINCQLLKPELKKLQSEAGSSLRIVDLNIDQPTNQKYIQSYQVLSTPTLILFDKSGKLFQKFENEVNPSEVHKIILRRLAASK